MTPDATELGVLAMKSPFALVAAAMIITTAFSPVGPIAEDRQAETSVASVDTNGWPQTANTDQRFPEVTDAIR
jgi:hypothetical protein